MGAAFISPVSVTGMWYLASHRTEPKARNVPEHLWCRICVHLFLEGVLPAGLLSALSAGPRHPALERGPTRPLTSRRAGQITGQGELRLRTRTCLAPSRGQKQPWNVTVMSGTVPQPAGPGPPLLIQS